jgi:hypothetical protein
MADAERGWFVPHERVKKYLRQHHYEQKDYKYEELLGKVRIAIWLREADRKTVTYPIRGSPPAELVSERVFKGIMLQVEGPKRPE